MRIHRARGEWARDLSALARRSKGHWGYAPERLDHWGPQLTVSAEAVRRLEAWAAVGGDANAAPLGDGISGGAGSAPGRGFLGWYALEPLDTGLSLEHFWIDPPAMGRGLGRRLLAHARARGANLGYRTLDIVSDPHAEGFYLREGAVRTGETAGDFDRTLPLLTVSTRPDDRGRLREITHVAETFAQALDGENYSLAREQIAEDCEYRVGDDLHRGPEAILGSYRASGDWVNATLDGIAYESHVEVTAPDAARITFVDHIRHAGRAHTHACEQEITLDRHGRIVSIAHRDLPGEPEAVARFLDEVGVDRGE